MSTNPIPVEAREEALRSIARFNQEMLAGRECRYLPRFKGKYLYLDREDFGNIGPICRLDSNRRKRLWEFAIYKCSADCYDPEEWFFPGSQPPTLHPFGLEPGRHPQSRLNHSPRLRDAGERGMVLAMPTRLNAAWPQVE